MAYAAAEILRLPEVAVRRPPPGTILIEPELS